MDEIAEQAEHQAISVMDEAQRRKLLVFSFFEDTVEWVRDFLDAEVRRRPELAKYRDRVVAVSGSDELAEVSRQQAVLGFAPASMGAAAGQDADRYDLLISTDVLAEGVNLQQCRNIINFDMPWNPMRLVQRHGRIDRIGRGARRGVFFCAVVGERTYLRFVPGDENWQPSAEDGAVLSEMGTCLRLIECEENTSTWCPDGLQERAYDFWEVAQRDIPAEWTRQTDPANLQPKVRPLNHRVAEFIRSTPRWTCPTSGSIALWTFSSPPGRDGRRSCCASGLPDLTIRVAPAPTSSSRKSCRPALSRLSLRQPSPRSRLRILSFCAGWALSPRRLKRRREKWKPVKSSSDEHRQDVNKMGLRFPQVLSGHAINLSSACARAPKGAGPGAGGRAHALRLSTSRSGDQG